MKTSKEIKRIAQIIALLLVVAGVIYVNSTATMSMGNFSGNGR
jgi:hypothetical protein